MSLVIINVTEKYTVYDGLKSQNVPKNSACIKLINK